jgi:hypothetical protein
MKNFLQKKKNKIVSKYISDGLSLYVKDPLPDNVDSEKVFKYISERIPVHLFKQVDYIIIGQQPEFKEREINAFYKDGAIYITNEQDDFDDMVDDIVHELAHSLEKEHYNLIYSDDTLEREFLEKRSRLHDRLVENNIEINKEYFMNIYYSLQFDYLLLKKIGYGVLSKLGKDLFVNPYAITSLREYFATGFEEYYIGYRHNLLKTSPILFMKLEELENLEKDY